MIIKKGIKFAKNTILNYFYKKPHVLSSEETIEYIINNKCSIGRYGDGELALMLGKKINFQDYDENLKNKLFEPKTTNTFLVCIPNVFNKKFFNKDLLTKEDYSFWKKNLLGHSSDWKKIFSKQKICGDAFVSRYYIRYKDKSNVFSYIKNLKRIWDKRNIIIVEGDKSKVGCENDLLNNVSSIRRIICPSINAFSYYKEILEAIKNNYNKNDLILIALGPTATVLSYDLSKLGIQALDLGHFDIEYEWYLSKADKKIPIKGKHVNECFENGELITSDTKYNSQIICKINEVVTNE